MSVSLVEDVIRLEGACHVEDAEPLLRLLRADPSRKVDLGAAHQLHTAVAQVLLALRPTLVGPAGDPFFERWLRPTLERSETAPAERHPESPG